jgi:hypothetical protein
MTVTEKSLRRGSAKLHLLVLPAGRLFGRITQKRPNKKIERPDKGVNEFWPILYRKGQKWAELLKK